MCAASGPDRGFNAGWQTILDPFIYASLVGALSPVFRADILDWPFFGTIARGLNSVRSLQRAARCLAMCLHAAH